MGRHADKKHRHYFMMTKKDAIELAIQTLEFRIIDFMFNHQDNANMHILIDEYQQAMTILEDLKDVSG